MNEQELFDYLIEQGATDVGFSEVEEDIGFGYAVSIVYKLSSAVVRTITNKPTMPYFQHYRTVNAFLDMLALKTVRFLENKGYEAFPVAASQSTGEFCGYFPHKTACVRAGLGYIGRSGLLITPKYGSAVRLATVLTDMPLSPQRERIPFLCGDCFACVNACPIGAISGRQPTVNRDDFFDAKKCSQNMKNYKDIGRGAVCGVCMRVCPKSGL